MKINQGGINFKIYELDFLAKVTLSPEAHGSIKIPAIVEYESKKYNVTEIDMYAFMSNNHITTVSIPTTLHKIWKFAFAQCEHLESIYFYTPDEMEPLITEIGEHAFECCEHLTKVSEIPSTLKYIGTRCFYNCGALTHVSIEGAIECEVGTDAFGGDDHNVKITTGNTSKIAGTGAEQFNGFLNGQSQTAQI